MDPLRLLPFVALYLLVIWLCVRAAGRSRTAMNRQTWRGAALLLGLLLIEKAAERPLLAIVTRLATREGWFGTRRQLQAELIGCVLVVGLLAIGAVLIWLWRRRAAAQAATLALCLCLVLAAYVGVRGISFHVVDEVLGLGVGPFRLRHLIENSLLAAVGLLAVRPAR